MDNFVWKFLPGYPRLTSEASAVGILEDFDAMKSNWNKHHRTMLFEMESGLLQSSHTRPFLDSELHHAANRNPHPKFVFRIAKR